MKMYQLEAEHPTVPGVINSTSFSRAEAEREGVECLRMIGDALIDRLENYGVDTADEKREAWAALRDRDDVPFVAFAAFVAGIQPTDGPEQRDNLEYRCVINEIDVEVSQRTGVGTTIYLIRAFLPGRQGLQTTMACANAAAAAARAKEFVCEIGEHMIEHAPQGSVNGWDIAKMNDWEGALAFLRETWPNMGFDVDVQEQAVEGMVPAEFITAPGVAAAISAAGPLATADGLATLSCAGATPVGEAEAQVLTHYSPDEPIKAAPVDVQPLDPADIIVRDMIAEIGALVGQIEQMKGMFDDADGAIAEALESAEETVEAAQAWRDKARPIGTIAKDVVRLAGIIVAGTEMHALLSEAMTQHIYDEFDPIEDDCQYSAGLKAWTDALAGIAVTTFAPTEAPEIAVIMKGGLVQNIVARSAAPVTVHIVDYDVEGGDEACIVEIPQGEGRTAGAFLQCYDGKLDQTASAAFWKALKQ